jgi:CRISPR/Cas system CSM-associated protein Csm3 (group 7 of RAMP superfamily)
MTNSTGKLSDPGGVRSLHARWVVTAELVLGSAAHLGGGDGDAADMVLVRDAREGVPLLPGTSLAGALRAHLADVLGGYRSSEDPRVAALFDGSRGDDLGAQSPLIVSDSLGVLPREHPVEIRDGVAIDPRTGTAEEHKKFDIEILPAGTRFPLRFECLVAEPGEESKLVSLLVTSLSALVLGEASIGARRSRGLGAVRAGGWRAVRHDLSSAGGWSGWVASDSEGRFAPDASTFDDPASACRSAHPGIALDLPADRRRRIIATADLTVRDGLLVRSAPREADAPDAAHLRSGGRSVLPGTSLAGALRNRATRIAGVVRGTYGDADDWVSRLFGPCLEEATASAQESLAAARLRVSEGVIENGRRARPSRIRVDRFTQGVVPGALFDEEPECGGHLRVRLELREPEPGDAGLLLLLLKDLLTGDLSVGGTAAVGRGVLRGTARVVFEDGTEGGLDPAQPLDATLASRVDAAIREFHDVAGAAGGAS